MGGEADLYTATSNSIAMMTRLRLTAFRVSLLVTLGLIGLYQITVQSSLMRNLETKLLDLRFHLRGVQRPNAPVALVVIDDQSIAELGRWPWSRILLATAVQRLATAGARVIAFDMLLSEPELHPVRDGLQALRTTFEALPLPDQSAPLQEFHQRLVALAETADPDSTLATALRETQRTLLAFAFAVDAPSQRFGRAITELPSFVRASAYRTLLSTGPELPRLPLTADKLLIPIAPLAQAAQALGHVNVFFDTDGTPRYEYTIASYQDSYYPSLVVQAVRLYLGLEPEEVQVRFGEGIQLGSLFVPTDEAMRLLVNYYGPAGTFSTSSFVDVFHNRLPADTFRGKIVLIGAAAYGLGDTFVTPFDQALPGVEKHATVITNILQGDALQRLDTTALLDLGVIVVLGLVVGWLGSSLPSLWGTVVALILAGGYFVLNVLALTRLGLWVNLLFPLLTVANTYAAVTLYRSLTEARQRSMLRQAFQYYLHPALVEQVSQHPELLTLGGEKRELTVLFSDIRGFSTFSEGLAPEVTVQLLNEYFNAMTQAVMADDGTVDKYIGDAIMALYGAPLPLPDHAYRACHTALRMLDALQVLQPHWQERGLPVIEIGIGINSGSMVVGNVGSDLRFAYTAMGDEVNLGSRLEGVNKEFGTQIIISEATWEYVKDRLATRELDVIRVIGKAHPTRIFEVLGELPCTPLQAALVQRFAEGLQAYRSRQWKEAIQLFQEILCDAPDDYPSQLYLQRCQELQTTPPPDDWDGVYTMHTK
jgi:adenylate cyclase